MPLVSMKPMLAVARERGFGIGAFNPVDYLTMKAGVDAAVEAESPIILQTSAKTVRYWGAAALAGWMRQLAGDAPAPVCLHLDHCNDLKVIRQCLDAGWTSVMIDASSLPFEENLALSKQVCDMARATGAGVEAELGEVGGVEDDLNVADADAHLADPEKAVRFCREMDLAVFAPAIGTAHGVYKGEPKIAWDRLEQMHRQISTPFALHGGTGLSDEVFQRCIRLGCAKINISTQLKYAWVESFHDYHVSNPKDYEPLKLIDAQYRACKAMIKERLEQFGAAGKANQVALSD